MCELDYKASDQVYQANLDKIMQTVASNHKEKSSPEVYFSNVKSFTNLPKKIKRKRAKQVSEE